jgi:hypothetical protein
MQSLQQTSENKQLLTAKTEPDNNASFENSFWLFRLFLLNSNLLCHSKHPKTLVIARFRVLWIT